MKSREEIFNSLKHMISEMFEIVPGDISLPAHLQHDLDIDSIDAVDLMVKLRELTGKRINPEDFKNALDGTGRGGHSLQDVQRLNMPEPSYGRVPRRQALRLCGLGKVRARAAKAKAVVMTQRLWEKDHSESSDQELERRKPQCTWGTCRYLEHRATPQSGRAVGFFTAAQPSC